MSNHLLVSRIQSMATDKRLSCGFIFAQTDGRHAEPVPSLREGLVALDRQFKMVNGGSVITRSDRNIPQARMGAVLLGIQTQHLLIAFTCLLCIVLLKAHHRQIQPGIDQIGLQTQTGYKPLSGLTYSADFMEHRTQV